MLKTMRSASSNVAVGFSSRNLVDTNDACAAIMARAHSDVAIFIKTRRRSAGVRSKRNDISKLAMAFGGGGHPHASGFSVPKKYGLGSERERQLFVERDKEGC